MSEEKKKHTLNVNGLEVDFSAVSSDNVPEGTITESLCEELASVLLYKKFTSYRGNNCERTGIHKYGEYGLNHKDLHSYVARKSTNANVNTASIYSILKNDSFYKDLKSTFSFLGINEFSPYAKVPRVDNTIRSPFHSNGDYRPMIMDKIENCHEQISIKFYTVFNPLNPSFESAGKYCIGSVQKNGQIVFYPSNPEERKSVWIPPVHDYKNDFKKIPLSFRFNMENGLCDLIVLKFYYSVRDKIHKCYYPLSLTNFKVCSYPVFAKIPRLDKQYLFNLDKIKDAQTVVFCMSIEDAWSLQETNSYNKSIAFTATNNCDYYEQVDFSPLKGKALFILISNRNAKSMPETYMEAEALCSYLKKESAIKDNIDEIMFIQRRIKYPSMEGILSFNELLNFYKSKDHLPCIIPESLKLLDKVQFDGVLDRAKELIEMREKYLDDDMLYSDITAKGQVLDDSNNEKCKRAIEKLLVRPLLFEGGTTLLDGPSEIGKSSFAALLCNMIASDQKKPRSMIDGLCIRRCKAEKDLCAIYLAFDRNADDRISELEEDFAKKQKNCHFVRGLSGQGAYYYNNPQKLVDLLERNSQGVEVGLIVIDCLSEFAGDNYMKAVRKYSPNIFKRFPNSALLWIHHTNSEGETLGGQSIESAAGIKIHLREHDYSKDKSSCITSKEFSPEQEGKLIDYTVDSNHDFLLEIDKKATLILRDSKFVLQTSLPPEKEEDKRKNEVYKNYKKMYKGKIHLQDGEQYAEYIAGRLGLSSSAIRKSRTQKEQ